MTKFKKILLVSAMALCLGGGVGGAVAAFTKNSASGSGQGDFDKCINLYWESGQSSTTLADCSDLVVGTPRYRYLSVTPKSTKTVAGNVTLTFTMAAAEGAYFVDGVTINVYKIDKITPAASSVTEEEIATAIGSKTASATVDKDTLTDTTSFAVAVSESVHETEAYYGIKVEYDGTAVKDKTLKGSFTIAQSFGA